MKKYKDIGNYDFSDYAEEITGDALFEINGGAHIENSIEAQANAQVGDTVTNSKDETHVLTEDDIIWAQNIMDSRKNSVKKENVNQGSPGNSNSGNNTSRNTENTQNDSASSSTDISCPNLKEQNNWTFNPNEPDSDKRYNAKDVKYKNKILHVMAISCDDAENFESFLNYYVLVGKDGVAGTTVYDGIGLMDKNGNVIQVLSDEKYIYNYARSLGIKIADGLHGDIFITAEVDLVAGWGFEGSISLVIDLDNWKDSGINISGGFAGGCNVGFGVGVGYVKRDLEGCSPIGCDGNFGYLPFSAAVMTDEEGFNGGSITFGPGMGVSSSVQNSYTLSINTLSKLIK